METAIGDFTKQLMYAMEATEQISLSTKPDKIMNVVISGIGCGIDMAAEVVASEAKIPVIVNKDYFLPQFVSKNTLVIICSYSGDAEEAVMVMEESLRIGARIICITSGGRIGQFALKKKIDLIRIPANMPSSVVAGFSFIQLLYIFNFYGILPDLYNRDMTRAIELLNAEENIIMRDAKETALELEGENIVIYSTAGIESVGLYFCQQLNENLACLCSNHAFTELNYNELQCWGERNNKLAVVIFRNDIDNLRISKWIDISEDIMRDYGVNVKEVYSKGSSVLERILYLAHWCDWVSYYLTERKNTENKDPKFVKYLSI